MPVKRHLMIRPVIEVVYIVFDGERGIFKQKSFLKLLIEQYRIHITYIFQISHLLNSRTFTAILHNLGKYYHKPGRLTIESDLFR